MVSFVHCVAHKDKYIAIVCARVETENPEQEIVPALRLLGRIKEQFVSASEIFVPTDDGSADGVVVTESYELVSHFESATSVARQGDVLHVCALHRPERPGVRCCIFPFVDSLPRPVCQWSTGLSTLGLSYPHWA